jgi:hypothetical protein
MLVLLIWGFVNYAIEMGSGAIIYIPSLMELSPS